MMLLNSIETSSFKEKKNVSFSCFQITYTDLWATVLETQVSISHPKGSLEYSLLDNFQQKSLPWESVKTEIFPPKTPLF